MADRPPEVPSRPPALEGAARAAVAAGTPHATGRVAVLATDAEWDGATAAWDALAEASPTRLPMASPAWVRAYARHRLDDGEALRVVVTASGATLTGVLPVVVRPGRLGPTLAAPHDDHTKSGDALLAPTAAASDLAALVAGAFALAPGARSLTLAGVRDGSRTLAALDAALAGALLPGPVVRDTDERGSYVPIAGSSLAALRATLSDNFRRNVRKAGNRLAKEPGVAIRLDRGPDASPATLDRFLALEAAGWKGRAGTAIALDARLLAFYRELVAGFAARGRLEWHTLEIAGAPAAMHLGVRTGGALVLLKIAYDERHARLGPGNLLFERVLEREFEAGTAVEVNCTTDMAWHRNWALPRSNYARLTCFPAGPASGSLAFLPAALKARAKRVAWLRRTFSRDARPGPEQDA